MTIFGIAIGASIILVLLILVSVWLFQQCGKGDDDEAGPKPERAKNYEISEHRDGENVEVLDDAKGESGEQSDVKNVSTTPLRAQKKEQQKNFEDPEKL